MARQFFGRKRSRSIWEHGLTCESNLATGFSSDFPLPGSLGLHLPLLLRAPLAATNRNKGRLLRTHLGTQTRSALPLPEGEGRGEGERSVDAKKRTRCLDQNVNDENPIHSSFTVRHSQLWPL